MYTFYIMYTYIHTQYSKYIVYIHNMYTLIHTSSINTRHLFVKSSSESDLADQHLWGIPGMYGQNVMVSSFVIV